MFRFKPGQKVVYTNPNGVCWGEKTVVSHVIDRGRPRYMITPTDTQWYAVDESYLEDAHATND
jgi:hypothetical protein